MLDSSVQKGIPIAPNVTPAIQRAEYLDDPDVISFASWMRSRLCEPQSFTHSWISPNGGAWSCGSLHDAYLRYRWPENSSARSFDQVSAHLDEVAIRLRRAVEQADRIAFASPARDALDWGRVAGSVGKLDEFWEALPDSLARLSPETANLNDLAGIPMNSSWTKLYHLLLDDFPIYDGRVGAALAYLVRLFLEEAGRSDIPPHLHFGWTDSRKRADGGPHRDPRSAMMRFRQLPTDRTLHARCNVMAAWLLGEVATYDCFGRLPRERQSRALEAALFMVGYELPALGEPLTTTIGVSESWDRSSGRAIPRAGKRSSKSPRRSRYEPLREWLDAQEGSTVTVDFAQLDSLVGGLPQTARRANSYWYGTAAGAPTHTWKRAWEDAGFVVDSFSRSAEWVIFRRM